MKKYLAYYENEWPANIAELTAVENKPFVGYLKGEGVSFTVIPEVQPNDEIWYTTIDNQICYIDDKDIDNAQGIPEFANGWIVSNTYNDKGVIKIDGEGAHSYITWEGYISNIDLTFFSNNIKTISLPENIHRIYGSLQYCPELTKINIPKYVDSISRNAFNGTAIYNDENNWDNGILVIDSHLVDIKDDTQELIINSNVKKIHQDCLMLLREVSQGMYCAYVPYENISVINNDYFDSRENCNAVIETQTNNLLLGCKNTVIPNSVTSINGMPFLGCEGFDSISYNGTVEQWNAIEKNEVWNWCIGTVQSYPLITTVHCTDGDITL